MLLATCLLDNPGYCIAPSSHSVMSFISQLDCDSAVLISDLHLSDSTARFVAFCDAVDTHWLIILGDLFEGYCGDDDHSNTINSVQRCLVKLHQRGVRVALMHGNRDFLIGPDFAKRCHAQLLDDPCVLNHTVLLSHGDAWCLQDSAYQQWRATCRQTDWQSAFLAQPLSTRQAQVQAYRSQSKAAQMDVNDAQTDVVDDAVLAAAQSLGCNTVIHGHTHRPSDRMLYAASLPVIRKVVLGDWPEDADHQINCARLDRMNGASQVTTFLI